MNERCRKINNCLGNYSLPIISGTLIADGVRDCVSGNYESGTINGAIGVSGFILGARADLLRKSKARKETNDAFNEGVEFGRIMQESEGKELYSSLDGKKVISSVSDLFDELGGSTRTAAIRTAIIVEHYEKGFDPTLSEVETLRKVKALMAVFPSPEEYICKEGQEIIETMNKIVDRYEEECAQASYK